MINTLKSEMSLDLYFILLLNLFLLSNQQYSVLNLNINLNSKELDVFNIIEYQNQRCPEWVPSLTLPISFIHKNINFTDLESLTDEKINFPFFPQFSEQVLIKLFKYELLEKYEAILARVKFESSIKNCYFGLSNGFIEKNNIVNENQTNLEILLNNDEIKNKIFSFSNWTLNQNDIKSRFYLGDIHENFKSDDGIIGTCDIIKNESLWGCYFPKISFNNSLPIELTDDNGILYKIFFSAENHTIFMPSSFKKKFDIITNNACEEENSYLSCNFFDQNDYVELKLIDEKRMNITIEIDEILRFIEYNNTNKHQTRILYGSNDYFILPLIMFKNFHVQFDSENNKISFYTTNPNILQVISDKKKDNNKTSSKIGTVFLVIFIILLVLTIIFGVFWVLKKRRNSVEKNINKYNKFEDEDNFQDMNEKRVF